MIDGFNDVSVNPCYDKLGQLELIVEGTKDYADLLQKDCILAEADSINTGYIIKQREYIDEDSTDLQIIAYSLNIILNDRCILGQQEFTGTIENVMKSFVLVNAVNPVNPNRIIPNLTIASSKGLGIETTEGTVNKPLCDYLYELAKKHDVSFDVLLDHTNKKFVFDVWQGADRTTEQDINPHIMFSKENDNILKQNYIEDVKDLKSTAIVLGEEGDNGQTIITVNDSLSGFQRKEIIVEATDIKKTYKDENDIEIMLTQTEFEALLTEKGKNTLSEYVTVRSLESEVDAKSNFVYGVDYFIGDKVSVYNDDLGIILHTRIISVIEKENKQGKSLQINFGSNVPELIDKIKRVVK